MGLHPQSEAYLRWMVNEKIPQLSTLSPTEARIWDAKVAALLNKDAHWDGRVENLRIPIRVGDRAARIYVPNPHASELLLYFHGGGWVLGNLDQTEHTCRLLGTQTGRIVVSVDYGLAPENKFPSGLEDCYGASKWIAENADKIGGTRERMAVGGDSAGGNLAAAVSLLAKDRGGPAIANQILIYPVTDISDHIFVDYPDELSPALTKADMTWFISHYIQGKEDLRNQYASPLIGADLSGLPPALLITAEYDILTKQCNEYAKRLEDAGVRVNLAHYAGMVHGFFTLPDVFDDSHNAMNRIAQELSHS